MIRTRLPSLAAACLRRSLPRSLTTSRPSSPQALDTILGLLPDSGPNSKLPHLRWDYDRYDHRYPHQPKNKKRKARPLPTNQPHLEAEPNTTIAPGLFVVDSDNKLPKDAIRRFNVALQCAYLSPYHDYHRQTLISCYEALKREAPHALNAIPTAAWTLLWRAQIPFRPLDADRLTVLEMLYTDMEACNGLVDQELRASHRMILDLEQLAENGKQEEAVEKWTQMKRYLEVGRKGRKSWLELGARLHAMAGDIDTASSYAEEAMRRYKLIDPRLRFFIIWRHAEIRDGDAYRRAAAMYTDLAHNRKRIFNLTTDDYHSLFAAFVKGGHIQFALEIVKDMAKDKHLSDTGLRVHALRSMSDNLQAACKDRKSLNAVSLACLGFLPPEFRIEELFNRWMFHAQRFWSHGEDDVCAQIAELMFERGDTPDARHLNILLKAWFENSGHDFTKQAESVAWGMIHKRMETEERAKMDGKTLEINMDNVPAFLRRRIPSAIATTFTQLAGGYVRQGKHEYAFYVLNLLANSDVTMDKKALRAVIQLHITMGEPLKAWQVFVKIRDAQPSAINLHTYHDLWRGLSNFVRSLRKTHEIVGEPGRQWHMKIRKSFEGTKFPNPRALFSEMLDHMQSSCRTKPQGEPDRIPRHLYDRVIGTMLYTGDVLGASIAMEIMKNSTKLYPTLTTIKMIVQYTALEAKKTESKQGINEPIKHYHNMAYGVLEYIYLNLEQHVGGRRPKISDLYNEGMIRVRGEDILTALLKYLRLLMERYWGSEEMVDKYEFAARTQMAMSSMEAMLNRKLEIWG